MLGKRNVTVVLRVSIDCDFPVIAVSQSGSLASTKSPTPCCRHLRAIALFAGPIQLPFCDDNNGTAYQAGVPLPVIKNVVPAAQTFQRPPERIDRADSVFHRHAAKRQCLISTP